MVVSTEKPKQVYIFDIKDDIKRGKTLVKYAFRYNIESMTMEHENEQGEIEEVQAWQYEEYISEQEFDLFLKEAIPSILSSLYVEIVPKLEQMQGYAEIEIPKAFDIEGDE
mgnify:CR=1 FL=1